MNGAKHTPGPWHVAKHRQSIYQTKHITRDVWTIPHCDADMDLIAAAPDLLAALKAALPWLETRSNEETIAVARAAIAKAEAAPSPQTRDEGDKP